MDVWVTPVVSMSSWPNNLRFAGESNNGCNIVFIEGVVDGETVDVDLTLLK